MRINVNTNIILKLFTLVFILSTVLLSACSKVSSTPPTTTTETIEETTPKPEGDGVSTKTPKRIGEVQIGAYIKGATWNKSILFELEDNLGHEFDIMQWFTSWPSPFEPYIVNRVLDINRIPLITWQSNNQSLSDIIAGNYDDYITSWAKGIKSVQGDVYLRPFPEMNGDWTNWHGEPEKLVEAWHHIVNIFRDNNVENVKWVWSPNITDEPRTPGNAMELYYPGSDYVDILGLDGFNWGTVRPWTAWKSFEETFEVPYERITALGDQPLWLAEIASTEKGGDKAQWIHDMLNSTAFPQIDALIWFNEAKETDWRIQSSGESKNAFKSWFTQMRLEQSTASTD